MKNKVNYLVASIIFLTISLLYFLVPFKTVDVNIFWINYIVLALIFIGELYLFNNKYIKFKTVKSKIYNLPLYKVNYIYIALEAVWVVLVTILNALITLPIWLVILLHIVITAIAAVSFITVDNALETVNDIITKEENSKTFINMLRVDTNYYYNKITDTNIKKNFFDFKELVSFSDPVSNSELEDVEDEIQRKYEQFKRLYENKELSESLTLLLELKPLLEQRNNLCKLSKK